MKRNFYLQSFTGSYRPAYQAQNNGIISPKVVRTKSNGIISPKVVGREIIWLGAEFLTMSERTLPKPS